MTSNLVSLIRNLQQRKGRKRRGLAVVEGVRLVGEALQAGIVIEGALVAAGFDETPRGQALLGDLAAHAVPLEVVGERDLDRLAETDTPQGVLAIVAPPRWDLAAIVPSRSVPVLVLDGVQDPGNVGTLLRTAYALGAAGAVLLKGTAQLTNPKVMRAGMGATFRLPTAATDDASFTRWVHEREVTVWVATVEGTPLERMQSPERLALVVGNEGAGVRPAVRALSRQAVTIPLSRGAESLNVAVAAGIILYEARRAA